MSLNRYAKSRDKNEPEIIKALEDAEPFNADAGAAPVVDMLGRAGGKARGARGSGPVRKLRADDLRKHD